MCALEKVVSGQPLNIPATTYNAMIDAARKANSINTFNSETTNSKDYAKVSVLNSSGSDLDRFFILGIDEPIILPADDQEDFESRITVDGITPEDGSGGSGSSDHRGRFAVIQEPIPDGEIGKSKIAGETLCKVNVIDEDDGFADVTDGVEDYLTSANTGSARILWKESGTGEKWALIRLGDYQSLAGKMYKATADSVSASAGVTVTAKATSIDDTLSDDEETLDVYDLAYPILKDDLLVTIVDKDGNIGVTKADNGLEVFEATADESSSEITVKRVELDGTLTGDTLTFDVLAD